MCVLGMCAGIFVFLDVCALGMCTGVVVFINVFLVGIQVLLCS